MKREEMLAHKSYTLAQQAKQITSLKNFKACQTPSIHTGQASNLQPYRQQACKNTPINNFNKANYQTANIQTLNSHSCKQNWKKT